MILYNNSIRHLSVFLLLSHFAVAQNTQSDEQELNKIITIGVKTGLDELNRNIYNVDQEMINSKGYTSLHQVFSYMPFISFSNVGTGSNIDIRGQGNSANVNTQIRLNGISLNLLDSSHGVTPLESIGLSEIENIEILPGGGAVMYGSGTRGGVVNIVTKKRYETLSGSVGGGYSYSNGSGADLNAKIGGKIGQGLYLSAGGNYTFTQGYRDGDIKNLGNVSGNLTWDINPSNSIGIDLDYFGSQENTTPLLHFADIANPTKKDRFKAGNGKIKTLQNRISVGANYDLSLSSSQKLNIKAFFQNYNLKYQDNLQIMDYHYASFNLPNTHINQDGSQFLDRKIGLEMQYNLKHENGNLIIGLDSIYNTGERNLNFDIDWKGDIKIPIPPKLIMQLSSYKHLIQTKVNANKWSNSLFLIEKYDFTQSFSLTAGGRYELAYYSGHRNLYNDMNIGMNIGMKPAAGSRGEQIEHPQTTRSHLSQRHLGTPSYGERASSPRTPYTLNKEFSQITHNYALELTPAFYFQAGNVYVKYEKGFRSPSPDNLTSRSGSGKSHPYLDTNVKSEDYHTFEVGSKLFAGDFAFFSLAGYYTLTQNEIYTIGSAHSGNGFKVGNYKLTQRAGAEIVGEQGFFDERLRLIESFSYVDARILDSGIASVQNNTLIPYVSNYKATLGLNYTFVPNWTFWINQSFVGSQKDTAQNTIPAYNLTDFGFNFNHQSFSLSFGIRNLFDSFYYDFYNKDKSDEIVGYAFLIAQGRSYFLEGHYKF